MNTSLPLLYTNAASPEFLHSLDKQTLTDEQIASCTEEPLAVIQKNEAYKAAHPPIGIYRAASEGSQSRDGGVIAQASSPLSCNLDDGQTLRIARKGDHVTYPDGRTAQIITGAGQANSDLALVGSRLSNGDEIINTLNEGFLFVAREGVSMAADFLPDVNA